MSLSRAIGPSDNGECGMKVNQAKRLKEVEKENARLKRLLADAELDKAILKETARGNVWPAPGVQG